MKKVSRSERIRLQLLFGLFGMGLMAIVPRIPDLKHNLNVVNGEFGAILSLGAIGGVTSLLFMGRLVQRIGVRTTLYLTASFLYSLLLIIPHLHTAWLYGIINIFVALMASAHNIALHAQTLQRQDETGEMLLPRMHGSWSIGVLLTVTSALILTSIVPFAAHIDVMVGIIWIATLLLIRMASKDFVAKTDETVHMERINFARIRRTFTFDKSIIVAFALGTLIEFTSGDWSTLVTNQEIHASKSASIWSYLALIMGMIIGRMYFVKLIGYRSERFWIRLAGLAGGGGFILTSQFALFLAGRNLFAALPVEVLAFLIAGLGTSFMSPLFTTIANRRSPLKPSEVVSQLNLANTVMVFVAKNIVAWVVQMTSISTALIIPGLLLMSVAKFAYLGNPRALKSL
jgi:MFS family permease